MTTHEDDLTDGLRRNYGYDQTLRATVLPSAKSGPGMGGSLAFDHEAADIKQNIIICENNEMKTIAVVDNKQLRKQPEGPLAPGPAEVEQTYLTAVNDSPDKPEKPEFPAGRLIKESDEKKVKPEPVPTEIPSHCPPEKTQAIPPVQLGDLLKAVGLGGMVDGLQVEEETVYSDDPPDIAVKGVTEEELQAQTQVAEKPKTISVSIKGPFGRVKQHYSSVFRDGNQLILMTINEAIQSVYELPEIEEEAMMVDVQVNEKRLTCVWAGIQFTLPDNSVTFTVLLIAEEQLDDEEE